jgi:amino acid transporter
MSKPTNLRRSLSLWLMVLYGLGTTIGAGIYVLLGSIVGSTGLYTPMAFLLASLMAGFTAFSYAELSARHPKAAGEAVYVHRAFGSRSLALATGTLMSMAVIVSGGAIVRGFAGYLSTLIALPEWLVLGSIMLVLGLIAAWGIVQSVVLAAVMTVIEVGGLLVVVIVGGHSLGTLPTRYLELLPPFEWVAWGSICSGAILAFYAFIGFESMVSAAEEIRDVRRVLPRAILWTLGITTALYLVLSLIAVLDMPADDLAASSAPLARLFEHASGSSLPVVRVIGTISTLNGAFIEIIVAARILYGLSAEGWLPAHFGHVHPRTQTPLFATAIITLIMLALALSVPIVRLAELASLLTLLVFSLANLSLARMKRREPAPPGAIVVPQLVPYAGAAISLGFLAIEIYRQVTD